MIGSDLIISCQDRDAFAPVDGNAAIVRVPLGPSSVTVNQFEYLPSLNGSAGFSLAGQIIEMGNRTLIMGLSPSDNAIGVEYGLGSAATIWDENLNPTEHPTGMPQTYAGLISGIAEDGTVVGWEVDPVVNTYRNFVGSLIPPYSVPFPINFNPLRLVTQISKDGKYAKTGASGSFGLGGLALRRTSSWPDQFEVIPDSFLEWPATYAAASFHGEWRLLVEHPIHGQIGIREVFHLSNDERIFSQGFGVWRMCDGAFLKDLGWGSLAVVDAYPVGSTVALAIDAYVWTDERVPNSGQVYYDRNLLITLDGDDVLDLAPLMQGSPFNYSAYSLFENYNVFFRHGGNLGMFINSGDPGASSDLGNYVVLEFPVNEPFRRDRIGEFDGQNYRLPTQSLGLDINQFGAGIPGAIPLNGFDSDGDGTDEQALFVAGDFLIDANRNGVWDGSAGGDLEVPFGEPGDQPVTGDWDGNGIDEVGIRRGVMFMLDVNGNGVWDGPEVDVEFAFGSSQGVPVVGDWNGDGVSDVGTFHPAATMLSSSGQGLCTFQLDLDGNRQWQPGGVDRILAFVKGGRVPVVGDWDGDGVTDLGVVSNRTVFLDLNGDRQWSGKFNGDLQYQIWSSVQRLIVGIW